MRPDDEWTADELAELESLSAEREPPPELRLRTADALRTRGLLRRRPAVSPYIAAWLAAAAVVVFASGALVGYAAAVRRTSAQATDSNTPHAVAQADSTAIATRGARQVVWF